MKKILVIAAVVLVSNVWADNEFIRIQKRNGGFFGYKTVREVHTLGNHDLTCDDPGRAACKFQAPISSTDRSYNLSDEDLSKIDNQVNEIILKHMDDLQEKKDSDTFVYNSEYLVVLSYKSHASVIEYLIYDKKEAEENGYKF